MIFAKIIHNTKIYDSVVDGDFVFPIKSFFDIVSEKTGEKFLKKDILFIQPIYPSKIIGVGLNYKNHAKEMGFDIPVSPVLFMKPTTSIVYNLENIIYPDIVEKLDYEAELGIVIKKTAKNISKEEAKDYILGYTCCNDVTARCLQKIDGQWTRAKGFDTFCPVGPTIVTDINPQNLNIGLKLNGKLKQNSNTSDMIFDVFEIVEFVSNIMTLYPGDLILTGTPEGIGPMKKGDKVEVVIQDIGVLENFVK